MSTTKPTLYGDLTSWALLHADSLALLRRLPPSCVDAVVTDPPYGIGFGSADWDGGDLRAPLGFEAFSANWAIEVRRVLRPGGWIVAFGAPRTFHRLVCGCEDAGLEIRDLLLWLHAAGVPKQGLLAGGLSSVLNPAYEPILLARAPLSEKTLGANLEVHGTGALDIDATRLPRPEQPGLPGSWPTNVLLSHDPDCDPDRLGGCAPSCTVPLIDAVGAERSRPLSRSFYAAKTSRTEREAGLERLPRQTNEVFKSQRGIARARANVHPTVKPIALMRWLIRLVCPVGGLVLDPFAGSGSTGCAAVLEGRQFIGIEKQASYLPIARGRLTYWSSVPPGS